MANKGNNERGWLRQRERVDGVTWYWCYQKTRPADGHRVEQPIRLGLVADIGRDMTAAWLEVARLNLIDKHINNPISNEATFGELCSAYVRDGLPFRKKDGRRKTLGSIETSTYHINNHILPRWKEEVASSMKPLLIRNWLYGLHDDEDYTWETCTKIKGVMSLIFDFVDVHEVYTISNPVLKVTIPATEDYHDSVVLLNPAQVMALTGRLIDPVKAIVLLVASTGVRISECLALRWSHVEWNLNRISIEQAFRRGEIQGQTKTKASRAPVPLCEHLASALQQWREETLYGKDKDFVFASPEMKGKQPYWGQTLNARHVKPAAIALGFVAEGERFGWHSFRHSLSTWVNDHTNDITVSQTFLRHANPNVTSGYTHGDFNKALDAQRQYMAAMTSKATAA